MAYNSPMWGVTLGLTPGLHARGSPFCRNVHSFPPTTLLFYASNHHGTEEARQTRNLLGVLLHSAWTSLLLTLRHDHSRERN